MEIKRNSLKVNLNIAPLIDIIFNLLLFFMLTYHISSQAAITLTLPQAQTAQSYQKEGITIFITKENRVYLGQTEVLLENLLSELKKRMEGEPKKVVIKADEKINLGLAVKVMDMAKQAGANNLIIAARQE